MNSQKYPLIISIIIFLMACTKEKSADVETTGEVEEISQTAQEMSTTFTERLPQIDDDLKVKIYELQERIKIEQNNSELIKQYCQTAFVPEKNILISMGIGTRINPRTGKRITLPMYERAALLDAKRWALYGEKWLNNNYQPPFGKIKSKFSRTADIIDKVVVGDSLFLYLATDLSK